MLQSDLRKDIKTLIYGEDGFSIELFDTEYFGLKKTKTFGPLSLSWFQVLGIQLPVDNPAWIKEQIQKIRRDYGSSYSNIFFQRGVINEIISFTNKSHTNPDFAPAMRSARSYLEQQLTHDTGLIPSFRENMPLSTIVIDTNQPDEFLLGQMRGQTQSHIRRTLKHGIECRIATASDYDMFYEQWHVVSQNKGFSIISKTNFVRLMDYLTEHKKGYLFVASHNGMILGGNVMLVHDKTMTYLYGFAKRDHEYRNMGIHHTIMWYSIQWCREHHIHTLDLFGGAPTGFAEHSLTSVSQFKESLGGKKVEYYGNYDIVLSSLLYRLFQYQHLRKKH